MNTCLLRPLPRLQACTHSALSLGNLSIGNPTSRRSPPLRHYSIFTSSVAPQTLTANVTLPFPALAIYEIITDIASYPEFIPYITSSRVLQHSNPDAHYKRTWPQLATLRVGYGDTINEEFTSSLVCVPPVPEEGAAGVGIVEAISGSTTQPQSEIPPDRTAHHTHLSSSLNRVDSTKSMSATESPLEFLRTRWTLQPSQVEPASSEDAGLQPSEAKPTRDSAWSTAVALSIEYKFRNPVYDMLGSAVAPKMAESMVRTFEQRVQNLLAGR